VSSFLFEWRDAMRAAPELIASDRHIALEMSLYMDKHGAEAWPGLDRIMSGTAMKKATVLSSIAWLLEAGWLTRSRRSKQERYRYAACVPTERKNRDARVAFMEARKSAAAERTNERRQSKPELVAKRAASLAASRSKRATDSAGLNERPPEQVETGKPVGLNGNAQWVETGDHGTPPDLPKNSYNPSPTASDVDAEKTSSFEAVVEEESRAMLANVTAVIDEGWKPAQSTALDESPT
jgi:hypothetical protein